MHLKLYKEKMVRYLVAHHRHQDAFRYQLPQDYQHQPHVKQLSEETQELSKLTEELQRVRQKIWRQLYLKCNNLLLPKALMIHQYME